MVGRGAFSCPGNRLRTAVCVMYLLQVPLRLDRCRGSRSDADDGPAAVRTTDDLLFSYAGSGRSEPMGRPDARDGPHRHVRALPPNTAPTTWGGVVAEGAH